MNKEIREINFKWFCLRLFCYLWTWQCLLTVSGLMFNSEKHSWYPSKGSGFRTNISRSSSNTEKPLVGRNLQWSGFKSIQWRQLFLLTSFFNYKFTSKQSEVVNLKLLFVSWLLENYMDNQKTLENYRDNQKTLENYRDNQKTNCAV